MDFNYIIKFTYRGKEYNFSTSANIEVFKNHTDGSHPTQSEARSLLGLIESYLEKEKLPCLPHDILVSNKDGILFTVDDLKPLLWTIKKVLSHLFESIFLPPEPPALVGF